MFKPVLVCATLVMMAIANPVNAQQSPPTSEKAKQIEALVDLIAEHLPAGDRHTRRKAAIGIFAVMMGALQLARAVPDKGLSDQILESGIDAALSLAREFSCFPL